jgi:methionyl-tRNA formyltransferase
MNKTKIIFLGTPEFSVPSLRMFLEDSSVEVSSVITQPDKPVGRKAVLVSSPVKILAENSNITIIQPGNINGDDVIDMVRNVEPDFIVVVAYGQLLTDKWFSLAKKEILNLHASLLPKYRGASPIQSAILDGCEKTGVSVMAVRKKMDSGPVYAKKEVSINGKNLVELSGELSITGAKLLHNVVSDFDSYKAVAQNEKDVSYCKKIDKEDGKISFVGMDCDEILRRYRAFYGWPGVFCRIDGKRLILSEIDGCTMKDFGNAGDIKIENNKIHIQTKKGVVEVRRLQLEGKKDMDSKSFLAGYPSIEKAKGE